MPRTARLVLPGLPHHVTQRGNNSQDVFFTDDDRNLYLRFLAEQFEAHRVRLVAWCLMSNHIHLVAIPAAADGLEAAIGRTHWRFSQAINRLLGRSGHLWQGRFLSCPLDEAHAYAAARYVERNPVRARIVRHAERYPWSSAEAHCCGRDRRGLVDAARWATRHPPEVWRTLLREPDDERLVESLRKATRNGRPLASDSFVSKLETRLGRRLRALPRGRPRKEPDGAAAQSTRKSTRKSTSKSTKGRRGA